MERIRLIGDETFGLDYFKCKTYVGDVKNYILSEREVQLRRGDDVIKLEAVNYIINEYDENERKKISFENPKLLMMTFSDKELLMIILQDENLPETLFVDDLTHIMRLEEVVEKMG